MSTIPLRDYCQKIESLIDIGNYDEAIFHSLAILNIYPKFTTAYRNLGKALLEARRYHEASDIFIKVLSVYPDDFISHVGLSSIMESDLNLDKAIWHMELAFDVQPSNVVVQEELRRLLGRRDGVAPNKIRLSRGALIRMYLKGELYQQAIAEIHAFQKIDQSRVDLDCILSKIYSLTGRLDEAVEISRKILENHPYNFESNKILSVHGDLAEKNLSRSRLIEIDPYFQFVTEQMPNPDEVASDNILIEEEIYNPPNQEKEAIPDWARQIGLTWVEETSERITQVSNSELTEDRVSPFTAEPSVDDAVISKDEDQHRDDDALPEWMKSAGWTKESEELPAFTRDNILPETYSPDSPEEQTDSDDSLPDWMKDIQADTGDSFQLDGIVKPEKDVEVEANSDRPSLDWAPLEIEEPEEKEFSQNAAVDDKSSSSLEEIQTVELPDWLRSYDVDTPEAELSQSVQSPSENLTPFNINDDFPIDNNDIESSGTPLELNVENNEPLPPISYEKEFAQPDIKTPTPPTPEEVVPDWVRKILGGSSITSALQENEIPVAPDIRQENVENSINDTLENPNLLQENYFSTVGEDELDIPEFITELPMESKQGLINDETNEELITWLDEVTAEDLNSTESIASENNTLAKEETLDKTGIALDNVIPDLTIESLSENHNTENDIVQGIEELVDNTKDEVIPEINDRLSGLLDESDNSPLIDQWLNPEEEGVNETPNANITVNNEDKIVLEPLSLVESLENPVNPIDFSDNEELSPILDTLDDSKEIAQENIPPLLNQLLSDIQSEPDSYEKWKALGDEYFRSEQIDLAIQAYSHAEKILFNNTKE